MGIAYNPKIVINRLRFYYDVANVDQNFNAIRSRYGI